jgi:antitoxin component YwqK of YwqJK toxin-antitoxin module
MILADGTVYDGEYKNGLKEGEGTITRSDGTRLVGTFVADLAHGTFKEYDAEGNFVKEATYVNGMSR